MTLVDTVHFIRVDTCNYQKMSGQNVARQKLNALINCYIGIVKCHKL